MSEADFVRQLVALLPPVARYARALTRDPDAADDLVQAVFLRALERRSSFAEGTNLEAWLITMMRNLYLTDERTRLTRLRNDGERCLGAAGVTAPNQLDTVELGDIIRAIATLPPRQGQMVMLVALSGLRGKGLAKAAGTSHQAAWNLLARGRQRLKELYA